MSNKFLIILKSANEKDTMTAINVSRGLKMAGAEDVKILFLGEGINALNKKFEISKIVYDLKDELEKNNIGIIACENAMKNYGVKLEDLIYYKELSKGSEVIIKYNSQGYTILVF